MKRVRAFLGEVLVADSENTLLLEGNYYFPKSDVNFEYLTQTETETLCPWKGRASYLTVSANGKVAKDACWFYPEPTEEARRLMGHYAFWGDVKIKKEGTAELLDHLCTRVASFIKGLYERTQGVAKKCPKVETEVRTFLESLGDEVLTSLLPPQYINEISFFNYYNSNSACFRTDKNQIIEQTNPTFNWSFSHLKNGVGSPLRALLEEMEVLDRNLEEALKTLDSHGWVKIPKIRVIKDGKILYYSLDVAITRHGDIDSLLGLQGSFTDITREIELSQSVEDLLNNAGQGFLSFSSDYLIQEKYSQICNQFFGDQISGVNILDLLFYESEKEQRENQKKLLDLVFSGSADMNLIRDALNKEVFVRGSWLKVEYRWIPKSEKRAVHLMMLVLTDITHEKELEKQVQEDQEKQETIIKCVNDREGFLEMQLEVGAIFEEINFELAREARCDVLFRYFHTVKGGTSVFSMKGIVRSAHELENRLNEMLSGNPKLTGEMLKVIKNSGLLLEEQFNNQCSELNTLLGIKRFKERIYSISESKLIALETRIQGDPSQVGLLFKDLRKESIFPVMKKYQSAVVSLAERIGKEVVVDFAGEGIEVDKEKTREVFGCVLHLLRNSVDHGIESPEERLSFGKSEQGHLTFSAEKIKDDLVLKIQDDGKGISLEKLKEVALKRGIVAESFFDTATREQVVDLIFHPGLSTKEEVTDISGRGVGMDAVKKSIEKLNGSISVQTEDGKGTTFRITLPKVA